MAISTKFGDSRGAKTPGQTTFCPLSKNGCSKTCALYDDEAMPHCRLCAQTTIPNVTVKCDLEPIKVAIDELTLAVLDLKESLNAATDHKPAKPKKTNDEIFDEWLAHINPFQIAGHTTREVFDSFCAWARMKNYQHTIVQRVFTVKVKEATSADIPRTKSHGTESVRYETTPGFLEWSAGRLGNK